MIDQPQTPLVSLQGWEHTPWVPHMLGKLGQHEVAGQGSNPFILDCYEATLGVGHGRTFDDSEIAWCSAAMNWGVVQCGIKGTGSLAARSWLLWGVECVAPFPGCIVVYSRPPDPSHAHVGVWMAAHGSNILTLGGNEHNAMNILPYPAERVLAYRQMPLVAA